MQITETDRIVTIELEREVLRLCNIPAEVWAAAAILRTSAELGSCSCPTERLACARRALLNCRPMTTTFPIK